ncbi:hypothetical protein [Pengzhenrongella frigida]|uniref:Uncharacterized protein n=1 Tax=Pengzhenrongella frigida TaxID=1259133 RepID=A0A4Q5MXY5_9MICO|nr:hypothetical protein [Cellulomonas sp. HLT2-17]RYV50515.1 hypothetical protein EUA98_13340 [Cellulomonas sp. HLT2-17]
MPAPKGGVDRARSVRSGAGRHGRQRERVGSGVQRLGAGTVGLCAGIAAPAAALIGALFSAPFPARGAWLGMAVIAAGLLIGFLPSRGSAQRTDTISRTATVSSATVSSATTSAPDGV